MEWFIYLFFAIVYGPKHTSSDSVVGFPQASVEIKASDLAKDHLIVKDNSYPFSVKYTADWKFLEDSYFVTVNSDKAWEVTHDSVVYNNENNRIPLLKLLNTEHVFNLVPKETGPYYISFSFDFIKGKHDCYYERFFVEFDVVKDNIMFEGVSLLDKVTGIVGDQGDLVYAFPVADFKNQNHIEIVMDLSGSSVDLGVPVFYSTNSLKPLEAQKGKEYYVRLLQKQKKIEENDYSRKKRVTYDVKPLRKHRKDGMTWILAKMQGSAKEEGVSKLQWHLSSKSDKFSFTDTVDVIGARILILPESLESKTIQVYTKDTFLLKAYTLGESTKDREYVAYYLRKDLGVRPGDFSMFRVDGGFGVIKQYGENINIPIFDAFSNVVNQKEAIGVFGETKGSRTVFKSEVKLGYTTRTDQDVKLDFFIEDDLGNEVMKIPDIVISSSNSSIEDLKILTPSWQVEREPSSIAKTRFYKPELHMNQNGYKFLIDSEGQNPYNIYDVTLTFSGGADNRENFDVKEFKTGTVIDNTYTWKNHTAKDSLGFYLELKTDSMSGYDMVGKYNVQIDVMRLSDSAFVVFDKPINILDDRMLLEIMGTDKETIMTKTSLVEMENQPFYAMHRYKGYLRAFSEVDSFRIETSTDEYISFYSEKTRKLIKTGIYHSIVDFVDTRVDITDKEFGLFPIDILGLSKGKTKVTYTYKGPDGFAKKQSFDVAVEKLTSKVSLLGGKVVDNKGKEQSRIDIFGSKKSYLHAKAEPRVNWSVAKGNLPKNTKIYMEVNPLYIKVVKDLSNLNEFDLINKPVLDYDKYKTKGSLGISFALTPVLNTNINSYAFEVGKIYKGELVVRVGNKTYPDVKKILLKKAYNFEVRPFKGFVVKRVGRNGHKYSITGGEDAVWATIPGGLYQRWSRKSNEKKSILDCTRYDIDYYKDFQIFKGEDNWGNTYGVKTRGTYFHEQKLRACIEDHEKERLDTWDTGWRSAPY